MVGRVGRGEVVGRAKVEIQVTGDTPTVSATELELDRQIVAHLERGEPEKLTSDQRSRLWAILCFLAWLLQTALDYRAEACFFQEKLFPGVTSNQVGKAIRNFACEADVPLEALMDYRIVKGRDVRLRSGPGMKEPILPVALQDRSLLQVLDSENRDWLLVKVVTEDVEGWISRKYTHRLVQ